MVSLVCVFMLETLHFTCFLYNQYVDFTVLSFPHVDNSFKCVKILKCVGWVGREGIVANYTNNS